MAVTLSRHLFTTRQQRFDVANGHVHIGGVLHILLHNAGDQLALLPGERAEHLVVLGLAEQLADDLTRGGGGQTAEVARGVIIFLAQSRRRVRIILGRLDGDLILSPNGKASGTRIKLHTSMLRRVRRFQICQSQCFRECGIQRLGIDSLPSCELVHSCQVQFHTSKTSYMKLFRALAQWSQSTISLMFHADTLPVFPLGLVDCQTRLRLGVRERPCGITGRVFRSSNRRSRRSRTAAKSLRKGVCRRDCNADIMADRSRHIVMRYLAAQEAVSDWANTAAYCPARFADGTLRSAQARHAVRLMASRLAIDIAQPTLSRCDGIDSLDVDTDSLAAMAAAEDQVGFAMEVFAARSFGHATLDISDRHKTTSQRLISLSGAEDNRAKTYDVTQLLANPNTIVDSATGLHAPTDAVLEMNCARSEIAAVAASSTSSNASTKSQTTSDDHSDDSREQSLGMLASMIADRVDLALDWGYPAFDEALFA